MNRNRIVAVLLAACLFLFSSCGSETGTASAPVSSAGNFSSFVVDVSSAETSTENETSTPVSSEISSETSSEVSSEISSVASSTELPSGIPSETSSQTSSEDTSSSTQAYSGNLTEAQLAQFENCAFIGNSLMDGVYGYNIIPTADFYTRTSLNVKSVYTASTKTGTKPIMEMVDTAEGAPSYDKIFLLFGINEASYSKTKFKELYAKIVNDLHEIQPDAEIYVLSIFPVTKAKSDKNQNGLTNKNINDMNVVIKEMCAENGATYLDVHSLLADENGVLPASNSSDGVHFKKSGYAYIAECVYDLTFGSGS